MNTQQELAEQMAAQTDQQLLDMFAKAADWTPQALVVARAELRKRGVSNAAVLESDAALTAQAEADASPAVVLSKAEIRKLGLKNLAVCAGWFVVAVLLLMTGVWLDIQHFLRGLAQSIAGDSKGPERLLELLADWVALAILAGWVLLLPLALMMVLGFYPSRFFEDFLFYKAKKHDKTSA
jgi:hypothetical protein